VSEGRHAPPRAGSERSSVRQPASPPAPAPPHADTHTHRHTQHEWRQNEGCTQACVITLWAGRERRRLTGRRERGAERERERRAGAKGTTCTEAGGQRQRAIDGSETRDNRELALTSAHTRFGNNKTRPRALTITTSTRGWGPVTVFRGARADSRAHSHETRARATITNGKTATVISLTLRPVI